MTIAAQVQGSMFRVPEKRMAKSGREFVSATMRVKDGTETLFVRVVAFSDHVQTELLRLVEGEELCAQGPLTASIYTPADGIAMLSKIGDKAVVASRKHGAMTFRMIAERPYINRFGIKTLIATWELPCQKCGNLFETTTSNPWNPNNSRNLSRTHCDCCKAAKIVSNYQVIETSPQTKA